MIYLLYTSSVSRVMREDPSMAGWLKSVQDADRVVICPITRGEILFGINRLAPGRRRTELESKAQELFATLVCEALPPEAGDRYADLKHSQQSLGLSLDENDLWIASTALAIGATLVSTDRDFARINALAMVSP